MSALYLILNVFTVSFPLLRSFEPRIQYYKKWRFLLPAMLITGAFFIIWDILFTRAGVWGFNPKYLTEIYIFNLPIEEWLFFLTVPFASVFIYECVIYFLPSIHSSPNMRWATIGFGMLLLVFALLSHDQAYTFWNFLFAGAMLAFSAYRNPTWLGHFWTAYGFHLIPFLAVNGILTGSFLEEPIVWYNNHENLGIRVATIPIEDSIYSLLLFLMTVTFYEKLRSFKK